MRIVRVFAFRCQPQTVRFIIIVGLSLSRIIYKRIERLNRIERCEHKPLSRREGKLFQIITLTREIFDAFKAWCRDHLSVQGKTTTVITAAQRLCVAFTFYEQIAPMRANIGQAVQLVVSIASHDDRLVEKPFHN